MNKGDHECQAGGTELKTFHNNVMDESHCAGGCGTISIPGCEWRVDYWEACGKSLPKRQMPDPLLLLYYDILDEEEAQREKAQKERIRARRDIVESGDPQWHSLWGALGPCISHRNVRPYTHNVIPNLSFQSEILIPFHPLLPRLRISLLPYHRFAQLKTPKLNFRDILI